MHAGGRLRCVALGKAPRSFWKLMCAGLSSAVEGRMKGGTPSGPLRLSPHGLVEWGAGLGPAALSMRRGLGVTSVESLCATSWRAGRAMTFFPPEHSPNVTRVGVAWLATTWGPQSCCRPWWLPAVPRGRSPGATLRAGGRMWLPHRSVLRCLAQATHAGTCRVRGDALRQEAAGS